MELAYHRRGNGSPLVLVHGLGSQWQVWLPVLEYLAAEHEVVAVDLPGFGESPTLPADDRPTVERLAAVVADFTAGLGLTRPHVAGSSLGGAVALELGRRGAAASVTALAPIGFGSHVEMRYSTTSLRASRA